MKRIIKSVDERYLEVIHKDMQRARLTVNPCTGRVTLKVSRHTPEKDLSIIMKIANMAKNSTDFDCVTYRGKIAKNKEDIWYTVLSPSFKKRKGMRFSVDT